jgi:hypothetical protein
MIPNITPPELTGESLQPSASLKLFPGNEWNSGAGIDNVAAIHSRLRELARLDA